MNPRRCDTCERIVVSDDDPNHAGWRHDAHAAGIDYLTILELERVNLDAPRTARSAGAQLGSPVLVPPA